MINPASEQSPPSLAPLSADSSPSSAGGPGGSPGSPAPAAASTAAPEEVPAAPRPESRASSSSGGSSSSASSPAVSPQQLDDDAVEPTLAEPTQENNATATAPTAVGGDNETKPEGDGSSSSSSGSSSDSDSGDDSDSDSDVNNKENPAAQSTSNGDTVAQTHAQTNPEVTAPGVVVHVVNPVEFDESEKQSLLAQQQQQETDNASKSEEAAPNQESNARDESSSSGSSSSEEEEDEPDEQSIAVENIPARDADPGVAAGGPRGPRGLVSALPEMAGTPQRESDLKESEEAAAHLEEALNEDLESNFGSLDQNGEAEIVQNGAAVAEEPAQHDVVATEITEQRTDAASSQQHEKQRNGGNEVELSAGPQDQTRSQPSQNGDVVRPLTDSQEQRNSNSDSGSARNSNSQQHTSVAASTATTTATDSQVCDHNSSQHLAATNNPQQQQMQQPLQQQPDVCRTNLTDTVNKHAGAGASTNNNNQCKKSLYHAPNTTLSGNPAPNFNTVDPIDVTQLGLESPTSMNSSDLTNTSVETTPSQTFSDCAQVQQQQQQSACANTHKSSPGNYMDTVSNSNTYHMTSPKMTSPGSSQGSYSLANQQPGSNQSGFNVPNPVPSPSNTNQSGKFNIPSMPNPSPTAGANQNYALGSQGGGAPNQSPSNASSFSVPPNPSPSNQGGANYPMPNTNPSPAANSNPSYNVPNPSPSGNYGNMPTPSPTNSSGSFTMAVPSPNANQQNFAVPQHPTQQQQHHPQQQPTQQHSQQQPQQQAPQPQQQQQAPPAPTQQPPPSQNQQQQPPPPQQHQLPPPLPISVAEMHHQPQSMMSTLMNHYPPHMPPHMPVGTQRLTHPSQNSCAHSPMGGVGPPPPPRMVGANFRPQNSSCSLAKLQQLTNGIEGMPQEMMPHNMTPPPNQTPPPLNPMTPPPPPPSMQRELSRNMTPPNMPPNALQGQLGMPSVGGPGNPYNKPYSRSGGGGGGGGSRGVSSSSSAATSLQKSPNVTVTPNMTYTPNVTLQPGTNVITGYNMMNLNWNRVPQQMQYIAANPGFSIQPQPPQMANMMGMNMMNMHPHAQPPNFQQQMPSAAAQPNNVYTTYGYNLGGMGPAQAYNLNMNGHVMRR